MLCFFITTHCICRQDGQHRRMGTPVQSRRTEWACPSERACTTGTLIGWYVLGLCSAWLLFAGALPPINAAHLRDMHPIHTMHADIHWSEFSSEDTYEFTELKRNSGTSSGLGCTNKHRVSAAGNPCCRGRFETDTYAASSLRSPQLIECVR